MLGIIGGTGLYKLEGVEIEKELNLTTPFGKPSAPVVVGRWKGKPVCFLPRHGANHEFLPSEINFRANLYALKAAGARAVFAFAACGSLAKEIAPGDLALVGQYVDWTRGKRASTFFGEGVVAHVGTASAACPTFGRLVKEAAARADVPLHTDVTYVCVEGPRFGTRAESEMFRGFGCQVVGMTAVPESFLALEAQLPYATLAISTDYDCWLDDPAQHVSAAEAIALYGKNISKAYRILDELLRGPAGWEQSPNRQSLKHAIVTPEEKVPAAKKELLAFLRG